MNTKQSAAEAAAAATRSTTTNHYEVLGVSESANAERVKEAFRSLILRHHPDKKANHNTRNDDAAAAAADVHYVDLINKAYGVLRDPAKRKLYDEQLRLDRQRRRGRLESALVVVKSDCVMEELQDGRSVLVYPCRCGAFLDTSPLEDEDEDGLNGEDENILECPGCSLVYDLRELRRG